MMRINVSDLDVDQLRQMTGRELMNGLSNKNPPKAGCYINSPLENSMRKINSNSSFAQI